MIKVRVKRLRLIDKIICIQISERNLAQKLNLFHEQRDFFIYIDNITVIYIHDMQSEELLIWAFFSNFAWMLQLAIVAKLLLIANFLDFKNDQNLILNNDNDKV